MAGDGEAGFRSDSARLARPAGAGAGRCAPDRQCRDGGRLTFAAAARRPFDRMDAGDHQGARVGRLAGPPCRDCRRGPLVGSPPPWRRDVARWRPKRGCESRWAPGSRLGRGPGRCPQLIFGMLHDQDAAGFEDVGAHARAARAVPIGATPPNSRRNLRRAPMGAWIACPPQNDIGAARKTCWPPARARSNPICGRLCRGRSAGQQRLSPKTRCSSTTVLIQLTSFCLGSAPTVAATWPF